MKRSLQILLCLMFFPALLPANTAGRDPNSAENLAIKRMEQLISHRWTGLEQYFIKTYSYSKSLADFESRLPSKTENGLFKGKASQLNRNRAGESRILNDGSLIKNVVWQNWFNGNWWDVDRYSYRYDQAEHVIQLMWEDWHDNIWNPHWVEKYTYSGDNLVSELWQDYDSVQEIWVNTDLWTNEFDGADRLIMSTYQNWIENQWQNVSRSGFQYDENGNEIEFLVQVWDVDGNDWVNEFRISMVYNQDGKISETTGQIWDASSGWTNLFRDTVTYDEAGRSTEFLSQNYNGSEYVNTFRILYSYDEIGTTIIFQNSNGETFINDSKIVVSEQSNLIEQYNYWWNGSTWQNNYYIKATLDENGNEISFVEQWGDGESWVNSYQRTQSYNEFSHKTSILEQLWENGAWLDWWRAIFEYTAPTSVAEQLTTPNQWRLENNYPNPFNPSTTISYQLARDIKVDLSIYNLLGQKMVTLISQQQPAGTYNVQWDASDMPSGVYFYKLQAGSDFVQSRKLVLLK